MCLQGLGGTQALDGHLKRLATTSVPPNAARGRVRKPAQETRCIDLFVLLRLLMMEYREEQAARCVCERVCVRVCITNSLWCLGALPSL